MSEGLIALLGATTVLIIILASLRLRRVSLQGLILGLGGAIMGLLLGALVSVPLSKLPQPYGNVLPIAVSVLLTISLIAVVVSHRRSLQAQWAFLRPVATAQSAVASTTPVNETTPAATSAKPGTLPPILVDTSVIIDGRIADIARAGFVPGRLVVPRFVLAELQNIADSDDAMRRGRGRRGLDVLSTIRDLPDVEAEIIEDDVPAIREVDAKLVALAQKFGCNVLTTDYNLNRVAQIQGVRVLNVNELSNAIRPVVLPGEELMVRVVQPGKERNQGVGYLADGTMIVVENGDKLIGQEVATEVTRVFQTVAGKMIFAAPRNKPTEGHAHISEVQAGMSPKSEPHEPASSATNQPQSGSGGKSRFGRTSHRHPNSNPGNQAAGGGRPSASGVNSSIPKSRHSDLESRVIAATNDQARTQPPKSSNESHI